jgi:hypothetical protein
LLKRFFVVSVVDARVMSGVDEIVGTTDSGMPGVE